MCYVFALKYLNQGFTLLNLIQHKCMYKSKPIMTKYYLPNNSANSLNNLLNAYHCWFVLQEQNSNSYNFEYLRIIITFVPTFF